MSPLFGTQLAIILGNLENTQLLFHRWATVTLLFQKKQPLFAQGVYILNGFKWQMFTFRAQNIEIS